MPRREVSGAAPAPVSGKILAMTRVLERHCPLPRPALVVMKERLSCYADTDRYPEHFLIRLSLEMDEREQLETLAHEWAHAMTWHLSKVDHALVWGAVFSRCYRIVIESWRPRRMLDVEGVAKALRPFQ